MELRSNVETLIRGSAQTANLHLKIDVKASVAIPEGIVHDLNQADDVVALASKVRGITEVDRSKLRLEAAGPGDDEIASRVGRAIFSIPRYPPGSLTIGVAAGVVTLTGTIKNAAWRVELRKICGAVEGVIDVLDSIETPQTEDAKIQKALNAVFGPRVVPPFPGRVKATVKDGVVSLTGHVPRLFDKLTAARQTSEINGIHRIDNQLTLGSGTAIQVIHP